MSSLNHNSYNDSIGGAALWVGFGFSLFATVVFIGVSALNDKPKNALFNYLAIMIVAITALAYLIEALGNTEMNTGRFDPTFVSLPDPSSNLVLQNRYLLWLRYAQWAGNTPLILATLGLLAGTTLTELAYVTVLSLITTGALFAAATSTGYNATWPIYALGLCIAIPIAIQVLLVWGARAATCPAPTAKTFLALSWLSFFFAIGYAVNWGTAEGGRVQNTDQEALTYTVLDILSRVVFTFILLFVPNAIEGASGVLTESPHVVLSAKEGSAAAPATV